MVQTSIPDEPVLEAVRSGDPLPYLEREVLRRKEFGLPPTGEVIVVEVSGGTARARDLLSDLGQEATVYGPAERRGTLRWLIQGRDLTPVKPRLRAAVSVLREVGSTVRVDVDPLDL
jgi:primosomal protein N' (replication factor Y)